MIRSSGQAVASTIPADNRYYLTTFGGGTDTQNVACSGMPGIADGSWYYAADNQRWPCGTKLLVTNPANGLSCIAQVADQGPAAWVEANAGGPVLDASPMVAQYLFGTTSSGWSDHRTVVVTVADPSSPLGPVTLQAGMDWLPFLAVGAVVGGGYLLLRAFKVVK